MTLRLQMHPSLGALTRAALRCSEELTPFLQPCKLAYIFGPLAAAAARGTMWLLPGEGLRGTDQHLSWRGAHRLHCRTNCSQCLRHAANGRLSDLYPQAILTSLFHVWLQPSKRSMGWVWSA